MVLICRIGGGTRSTELLEEVQMVESSPVILLSHQQQEGEEARRLLLFTLTFSRETNQSHHFHAPLPQKTWT